MAALGTKGIEQLRHVATNGPGRVQGRMCDSLTAQAITTVWDGLKPENRARLESLDLERAADTCWKLVKIRPA